MTGPAEGGGAPAPSGGVAHVVLDVPLPHLDRAFDYAVPPEMAASARPGTRVRARFAGRDTAGFIVGRSDQSDHPGRLTPLRRVVSPVPVLTPEVLATARAVADHYGGTLSDVLRLAVPPRHARAEQSLPPEPPAADSTTEDRPWASTTPKVTGPDLAWAHEAWAGYAGGTAFIRRLAAGESPRAVWSALPDGPAGSRRAAVAAAVAAALAGGRGVVVVAPEVYEVERLSSALDDAGIGHVRLVAEDGPSARYRAFLRALHGHVDVVVGTRAAAFAPLRSLGLVVVWDEGDDLLAEPRAPYPHTLRVLQLRAEIAGAGALVGGYARSCAAQQLLADGWGRSLQAPRPAVRARTPRVLAPGEGELAREGPAAHARIPHLAWELVRSALPSGPVLVQVPRAGYIPVTACATCRAPARCPRCSGPLRLDRPGAAPTCSWCGRPAADWACSVCEGRRLRAGRLGSSRTAEELGRAFPGVPVAQSAASAPGGVLRAVDGAPRLVVATPGAEPEADGCYAAALLLDAAVTSGRPELWAAEEALRRWLGAAALVRSAPEGGRVMLLGMGAPVPVQALVRWDPAGFAERELAERVELAFPPAVALASVDGDAAAVRSFLQHLDGHLGTAGGAEVLGPVPVPRTTRPDDPPAVRALVRTRRESSRDLSRALAVAAAERSARKEPGAVRVQVDPRELW